jgi:katanin p60 ATPase-containing subunit A1
MSNTDCLPIQDEQINNSSHILGQNTSHTSSNYTLSKINAKAREVSEKLNQERKKAIMVFIHSYLLENKYISTAREFTINAGFNIDSYSCADNIDLETIFIEYEEYYSMKFGKKPKFLKRNEVQSLSEKYYGGEKEKNSRWKPYTSNNLALNKMRQKMPSNTSNFKTSTTQPTTSPNESSVATATNTVPNHSKYLHSKATPPSTRTIDKKEGNIKSNATLDEKSSKEITIDISGKSVMTAQKEERCKNEEFYVPKTPAIKEGDFYENRILKPLPEELFFGEMRDLAEIIKRDILVSNPEVYWDDIAGLMDAKQLIKEAVVIPLKHPELFKILPVLSPWNGVLLFGPPGTGKTMLAKAVATECKTTFFNISASSIVSKWRGDSEKLVRILFDLAEYYAPSTIFLDELDSIMSQRQSSSSFSGNEHEGSRRMKTELLIQMDGLSKRKGQVFVLAASNLPWDLDQAILRRLEKRILVGLPDEESRCYIFKKLLNNKDYTDISEEQFCELANQAEDYSGADLALVCKESAMKKLRQIMDKIAEHEQSPMEISTNATELLKQNKISMQDVQNALAATKPSGISFKKQYEQWKEKFGSNGAIN